MADRFLGEALFIPQSLPPQLERGGAHVNEMYSYPESLPASEADADWMMDEEKDWLLRRQEKQYGSLSGDNSLNDEGEREQAPPIPSRSREPRMSYNSRNRRGRRKYHGRRLESTTVASLTRIFQNKDNDDDESSSEEEEPPIIQMIYRRSRKDMAKLIILPTLYFALMILAFVFAFYTIEGLILSYHNKVRSVQVVEQDRYPPIGIAILPQFAEYHYCQYRYYDNVSPHPQRPPEICSKYQIPITCMYHNVTFNSTALRQVERFAMVFQGPTLVDCKESLLLHFVINTTVREFSAVEYILFANWDHFNGLDDAGKQSFLAKLEQDNTIYTFPAGFRTWVKMTYSVRQGYNSKSNTTEFSIIDNYASFNDPVSDGVYPLEVLFEWKSRNFDYITEILSTTAWSAFGSLCGVFITLVKAGEYCRMWLRRIRRERQKKELHLKKLEEEQEKLMEEYRTRQKERRETKLRKSFEATKSNIIVRPVN